MKNIGLNAQTAKLSSILINKNCLTVTAFEIKLISPKMCALIFL